MDRSQQNRPDSPLWNSLLEVDRALESLRGRLQQLERSAASRAPDPPETLPGLGDPLPAPQQRLLARLQEVSPILTPTLDLDDVFGLAMDRVTRMVVVDRAALFLLDPDKERLRPRAFRGFRRDDLIELSLPPGEGVVGRAFREGRPLVYARPAGDPAGDGFISRFPVEHAIVLPIRADGEVVGVLYAGRRTGAAPFGVDDVQLLILIADRLGTALAQRRLVDKIAGHADRLRELAGVCARSSLRFDIEEMLSAACEAGCRMLRVGRAAVAIVTPGGELGARGSHGFPERALEQWGPRTSEGLTGELFASREPVVCADLLSRAGSQDPSLRGVGLRSVLLLPLWTRNVLSGCLYLGDRSVKEFSADDVEAARLLGALVGIGLENAQLYNELRRSHEELQTTQEQLIQSEKTRALGEMAAGIAHEFNNILAIIVGKTQLMRERGHEAWLQEDLGVIEEAAWRAADIVRRLQRFALTRMEEKRSSLDLNRLIEEAIALTRPRWKDEAEARGIRVEVVTDLEETPAVPGNPSDLREVVTNLILNALDAMANGGRLVLSTRNRQDTVELVVTDTGVGMPQEVRRRVFEPFFTTRSPQRAGLGLSVVHGIIARHKGTIEIESQEGCGTACRIRLPIGSDIGAVSEPTPRPPSPRATGAAQILVIEDEDHLRRTLGEILAGAGHSVETARDGLDGLARFQRERFDLVMTDLSMPECSGLEVARALKKMNPATPVVLMTGWGDLLDPARIQEAGVDLLIVKPYRVERVLNVVADALRLRRASIR